jgi:hypothetical protein
MHPPHPPSPPSQPVTPHTPTYRPTRTPVVPYLPYICPVAPPPLCVCPRSDKVLLNYQAEAAYVPEEPPKDTVVKKKRKAPAGRMVTSSKGAKLPF